MPGVREGWSLVSAGTGIPLVGAACRSSAEGASGETALDPSTGQADSSQLLAEHSQAEAALGFVCSGLIFGFQQRPAARKLGFPSPAESLLVLSCRQRQHGLHRLSQVGAG